MKKILKGVHCKRTGKVIYKTHEAALMSAAAQMIRIKRIPPLQLSSYKCPFHNHWHLTSQT